VSGIIIVCAIVTAGAWSKPNQHMVIARSEAACSEWSNHNGGTGLVASSWNFDLSNPDDLKRFELKCGPEGADCKKSDVK
jgi:hypothetical protein